MKHFIVALLAASLAIGAAHAQTPTATPATTATTATPATTVTPVHKKAAPPAKHKKAYVKRDRIKKTASF